MQQWKSGLESKAHRLHVLTSPFALNHPSTTLHTLNLHRKACSGLRESNRRPQLEVYIIVVTISAECSRATLKMVLVFMGVRLHVRRAAKEPLGPGSAEASPPTPSPDLAGGWPSDSVGPGAVLVIICCYHELECGYDDGRGEEA